MMQTFEITSGTIRACDPCYKQNITWCTQTFENVLNGTWRAYPAKIRDNMWGERISELTIVHEDYSAELAVYKHVDREFCVDSGQFGFFDGAKMHALTEDQFEYEDGTFYMQICEQTLAKQFALIPWGAASSSGYGDGSYDVYEYRNAEGKAVSYKVVFIDPYEDEYTDDDYADDWNDLMEKADQDN